MAPHGACMGLRGPAHGERERGRERGRRRGTSARRCRQAAALDDWSGTSDCLTEMGCVCMAFACILMESAWPPHELCMEPMMAWVPAFARLATLRSCLLPAQRAAAAGRGSGAPTFSCAKRSRTDSDLGPTAALAGHCAAPWTGRALDARFASTTFLCVSYFMAPSCAALWADWPRVKILTL